ncbi:MAG: fibronectin-binding protein, partial [Saprospiraceae bacterium]|nr:fibronectin-binding protein [Pyrinomonadaceae bacterium]
GAQFEGSYDVSGTNSAGSNYTGKLEIKRSGEGYDFNWNAGGLLKGFGIREGNKAAVGIGGNQCGFVLYEAKSDGTLAGKWGGKGAKTFGTETLTKK